MSVTRQVYSQRKPSDASARVLPMPTASLVIRALADCRESIPELCRLLGIEWPAWYGQGAAGHVARYANRDAIPLGLVAFENGTLCGFAGLKTEAISGYECLEPWVGAACVVPELRNRGIGSQLVLALEQEARRLGFTHLYAGTGRAGNLLHRCGWRELGMASQNGEIVSVYWKAL
jgi:GNAT superfamily N-acetyltransferase